MKISRVKYAILNSKLSSLEEIRESQIGHSYVMPTDYSHVLQTIGKLSFSEIMQVVFNGSCFDFDEFYDLELIEWQLKHTRKDKEVLSHNFWLKDYLCIGQMTSKHILIGVTPNNSNKIYLFDNEEAHIDFISNDFFTFLNEHFIKFES